MTFILIHGAWHDSRAWERIAPRLRRAGHEVLTPDLPGSGRDATPAGSVTLRTYIDAIAAEVGTRDDVCLVGHSLAGIVLSGIGEAMPDRVRHLVYVAAFMLPDGFSVTSFHRAFAGGGGAGLRPLDAGGAPQFIRTAPDGTCTTIDPAMARDAFFNACAPDDVDLASHHLGPQPTQPRRDPVHVADSRWGRISRTYIKTLRDNAVSPALQDAMIELSPGTSVVDLDCDHSPFYSAPEELIEILLSIGGRPCTNPQD